MYGVIHVIIMIETSLETCAVRMSALQWLSSTWSIVYPATEVYFVYQKTQFGRIVPVDHICVGSKNNHSITNLFKCPIWYRLYLIPTLGGLLARKFEQLNKPFFRLSWEKRRKVCTHRFANTYIDIYFEGTRASLMYGIF